jgi:hypothetical protein
VRRSGKSRCGRQDGDKGNENGRRGLALITFSSPMLARFVGLILSLSLISIAAVPKAFKISFHFLVIF